MPILKEQPEVAPEQLFDVDCGVLPWQVAYVRSRQEKLLARHLSAVEVAHFLPLCTKRVHRNGRRQTSHLPLLPGYVFFRGFDDERRVALRSNVVVEMISIPDQKELHEELLALQKLRAAGLFLAPLEYLEPGDDLEIKEGPFAGLRGKVLRGKGRDRLVVSIPFLQRSVVAEVLRQAVEPAGDFWHRRYAQALRG